MSAISKQALVVDNSQSFPNNNAGAITPTALRNFNTNMIDSNVNQTEYNTNSGSWNVSISNLNTFTASQQPSFTALNSFTASQLTINTGYNSFTQSTNVSINSLTAEVDTLQTWTGSVNAISDNGVLQGYSTRLNFYGLMTASIVANVGGPIAAIGLLSDTTRVSTSSFNAYTASTDSSISNLNQFTSSQISFNASATASITQLLSFSSSLDATYATDAQLAAVSASLVVSLNTKLNTSSFNSYTQSVTNTINELNAKTGSFATTGSNTFIGNQLVTNGALQVANYNETSPQFYGPVVFQGVGTASVAYDHFVNAGNFDALHIETNLNAGTIFQDYGGGLNTWLSIPTNTGNNPAPIMQRGLIVTGNTTITGSLNVTGNTLITGSTTITGSQTIIGSLTITGSTSITGGISITGSANGNLISQSISSLTASIDLDNANFFILTLTSGSTIRLEANNIKKGKTINLLIQQPAIGTGSLSYPSYFKFSGGTPYSASAITSSVDILTFVTFDTGSVYTAAIKNLK